MSCEGLVIPRTFRGNPVCPDAPGLVLFGQQDQADLPRGQVFRNLSVESVLIVDLADQFNGFHGNVSLAIWTVQS